MLVNELKILGFHCRVFKNRVVLTSLQLILYLFSSSFLSVHQEISKYNKYSICFNNFKVFNLFYLLNTFHLHCTCNELFYKVLHLVEAARTD